MTISSTKQSGKEWWVRFSPQDETHCHRILKDYFISSTCFKKRSFNEFRLTPTNANIEKHYLLYCHIRTFIVSVYSRERVTIILTKTLIKIAIRFWIKIVIKINIISKISCQSKFAISRSRCDDATPIRSARDQILITWSISTNQNPSPNA